MEPIVSSFPAADVPLLAGETPTGAEKFDSDTNIARRIFCSLKDIFKCEKQN